MKETLTIYSFVDGINDIPFYDSDNPITLTEYTYSTQRMGASSLSATLLYPVCLDDEWNGKQYVTFQGEKFFLKNVPSSGKSNDDERYRHSLEFAPERDIVLGNTYFYDAVSDYSTADDKYKSNSSKVIFFGDISEFVNRIHQSMQYSGLEFSAHLQEGLTSEVKQVSFEGLTIFEALQQAYEVYEIPFYFVGKQVWFGFTNNVVSQPFEYGVDNELLSVQKNNANYKIVTRCTGTGSSDNIPYYYPNISPKGNISAKAGSNNTGLTDAGIVVTDYEKFSQKMGQTDVLTYVAPNVGPLSVEVSGLQYNQDGEYNSGALYFAQRALPTPVFTTTFEASGEGVIPLVVSWRIEGEEEGVEGFADFKRLYHIRKDGEVIWNEFTEEDDLVDEWEDDRSFIIDVPIQGAGTYKVQFSLDIWLRGHADNRGHGNLYVYLEIPSEGWELNGEPIELKDLGLSVSVNPHIGDTIIQEKSGWITPSEYLMPPIYREENGAERFYNAINHSGTAEGYPIPGTSGYYFFENEYVRKNPREHIVEFPDIKPTVQGMTNASGQIMAQFLAVDFDGNDNDEQDESGNYLHPYFYAKLPKFDGEYGFNLFDHAIDEGEMTFVMRTGPCAGCHFVLGVSNDEFQKNIVQVNSDGSLKKDSEGNVVLGEPQERQNDTINNEVWVALKKEFSTFGVLMPNDEANYKPTAGNEFAIIHILLPQQYIEYAENQLKEAIIKYMAENNSDKFNFSINFSRVFFAENQTIYEQVDENARITVRYNGDDITLYITSFTYRAVDGESLPEITVELAENVTINRSSLQNTINEIKGQIAGGTMAGDILAAGAPHFVSKTQDDVVAGYLKMLKGLILGDNSSITVDEEGNATAIVDFLKVNKKAVFSQIEVQEKYHIGGQLIVSLAAMNCNRVVDTGDAYRCYFETDAGEGDGVANMFEVNDQAICQTFNAWGSKYYWRLVTEVGENYIDLSKEDCDVNSNIPEAGDKIIQLGNRENADRQNAITLSAHGDEAPCMIQYKGINRFELADENIVTKFSPQENIITGKVHMQMGSDGLENINGGLNIGGQNLLRNSGFTGDYLSEPLADREVMDASKELFSDPLDHWKDDDTEDGVDMESWGAEVIELAGVSASGYGASLNDVTNEDGTTTSARLYQNLYYDLIGGETYVLSFKAMGGAVTCIVGDYTEVVSLTDEWAKYTIKATPSVSSKVFSIVGTGVTLCEIQLERGTMATSWGMSPLDNSSDRTYYESIKYLSQSMVEEAITEGATDVLGGVVLTKHIKVGNYANQTMIKETGGVSGTYTDDDSVAFWGGGDFASAMEAVSKFKDNPAYQPTEEELASMASFVVTHGGRAILNDIILRGYVYAKGGNFQGKIDIDAKNVNGRVVIDDNGLVYYGTDGENGEYKRVALGSTCQAASGVFLAPNADASYCVPAALLAVGDENTRAVQADGDVRIVGNLDVVDGEVNATKLYVGEIVPSYGVDGLHLNIPNGMVMGLRTITKVVESSSVELNESDFSVLINVTSGSVTITFPSSPMDGQEYMIETKGADLTINSSASIYNHYNGKWLTGSITNRGVIRFKYYDSAHQWTMTWIDRY